jgi:hypothetical protein
MKADLLTATYEVIEALGAREFKNSGIELGDVTSVFEYRYTYSLKLGKRWAKVVCVNENRKHIWNGKVTSDENTFGGVEFFIDTTNGNVHKPQGPVAAKTPRYNLLDSNSRQQLIVNAQASQHGSYLYQDFSNLSIAN